MKQLLSFSQLAWAGFRQGPVIPRVMANTLAVAGLAILAAVALSTSVQVTVGVMFCIFSLAIARIAGAPGDNGGPAA